MTELASPICTSFRSRANTYPTFCTITARSWPLTDRATFSWGDGIKKINLFQLSFFLFQLIQRHKTNGLGTSLQLDGSSMATGKRLCLCTWCGVVSCRGFFFICPGGDVFMLGEPGCHKREPVIAKYLCLFSLALLIDDPKGTFYSKKIKPLNYALRPVPLSYASLLLSNHSISHCKVL